MRRALDRVWIAYLHLHGGSLYLTTPFLRCNGLVPALVAVEVESHERRGVRRDWRRNDAMCRGAESSESPSVGLRASASNPHGQRKRSRVGCAFAAGTTRYILPLFPVFILLSVWGERRTLHWAICICFGMAYTLLLALFIRGAWAF